MADLVHGHEYEIDNGDDWNQPVIGYQYVYRGDPIEIAVDIVREVYGTFPDIE